jgi:intergrase/recombinase
LWDAHKGQFSEWLSYRVIEKTAKDYIKALDKFMKKYKLETIGDLVSALQKEHYTHHLVSALRNFVTFLEEREIINEDAANRIRKYAKIKKSGVDQTHITNDELREAWKQVLSYGEKRRELTFKLLVFSGLRLSHVHYLLTTFDASKLIFEGNIAKYPLQEAAKGTKRAFYAYMPADFAKELEPVKASYDAMREWVRFEDKARRVKAKTIRKWHFNFLIRHGVSFEVADFIQGRAPRSIGERHYANLEMLADEAYSRIVDYLVAVLEGEQISKRKFLGVRIYKGGENF